METCKLEGEEKGAPLGPYTLKWANLPSLEYKRLETIIDIPCDVKENCKPGRQLDLFGIKVTNNNPYIIIQDTQQQASRKEIYNEFQKHLTNISCSITLKELKEVEIIDKCLFDKCCDEKITKEIFSKKGYILRVLFDFPPKRTYYMAVRIICANAKSKIEVFQITRDNNKIKIEKCNDKNILDKIECLINYKDP